MVTLKTGSWYGDYNIMLGQRSVLDLEAGADEEDNEIYENTKPSGMPHDHIMVYKLDE